jgi:YidC/Oxa1 family membrane protein insertase
MKNTAPEQKRIMRFLPPVFGVVLVVGGFPAGLFVYWVASNVISIFQNLLIYRTAPKAGAEADEPEANCAAGPDDDGYRAEDGPEPPSAQGPNGSEKARTRKRR